MRTTIFYFLLLIFSRSTGQTYSSIVTDQEIHNFFCELNRSKSIHIHKLNPRILPLSGLLNFSDSTNKELPFYFLDKASKEYAVLQTYFRPGDIISIKQQSQSVKDSVWNFEQLKGFIPADSSIISDIVKKSQSGRRRIKDNYSYTFSVPLFSLDKKSVIIYQDFFCGSMCSTACFYFYQKDQKGRWKEILSWSCYSS